MNLTQLSTVQIDEAIDCLSMLPYGTPLMREEYYQGYASKLYYYTYENNGVQMPLFRIITDPTLNVRYLLKLDKYQQEVNSDPNFASDLKTLLDKDPLRKTSKHNKPCYIIADSNYFLTDLNKDVVKSTEWKISFLAHVISVITKDDITTLEQKTLVEEKISSLLIQEDSLWKHTESIVFLGRNTDLSNKLMQNFFTMKVNTLMNFFPIPDSYQAISVPSANNDLPDRTLLWNKKASLVC